MAPAAAKRDKRADPPLQLHEPQGRAGVTSIQSAARPRALHPALPLVCVSFAACAAALYLQLRYHAHLSRIKDVGAFLDTAQAAAFASAVLLCVTLALNALALCAAAVCARKAADRA